MSLQMCLEAWVTCDDCGDSTGADSIGTFHRDDKREARRMAEDYAKALGWTAYRDRDGLVAHRCPPCVARGSSTTDARTLPTPAAPWSPDEVTP